MKYKRRTNILILLALVALSELSASTYIKYDSKYHTSIIVNELNAEIKKIFTHSLIVTSTFRTRIRAFKTVPITLNHFNLISESLLDDYTCIDAITLLPDGITTFVYPYAEHQLAIGPG